MKATIVKTDGTRIEAEGTPEDIAKLAGVPATQYVYLPAQPCTLPHYPAQWPLYPQGPFYSPFTYGRTTGAAGLFGLSNNAAAGNAIPASFTVHS